MKKPYARKKREEKLKKYIVWKKRTVLTRRLRRQEIKVQSPAHITHNDPSMLIYESVVHSNAVKNRTAVTISDLNPVPRIQATPDNPMTGQEKTQFDLERPCRVHFSDC